MTTLKSLPTRPSFEAIRKQAKALARDVAAGNPDALARARANLPSFEPPLSLRDAQLILAREYGFAGWHSLKTEVLKKTGEGLPWARARATQAIRDDDLESLRQLLEEYPALIAVHGSELLQATTSYANDANGREELFNRPACAEVLIDAGAEVDHELWRRVISTRSGGMLQALWRKGALPGNVPILAALGELDAVSACFDQSGAIVPSARIDGDDDRSIVNEAFSAACRFGHATVAAVLLEHCIRLDPELGRRIETWRGRAAFIQFFCENAAQIARRGSLALGLAPWPAFVIHELFNAMKQQDLPAFEQWLRSDTYLLGEAFVDLQVHLIEHAAGGGLGLFMEYLLDRTPAVLTLCKPPPSRAITDAIEYGHAKLVPLLARIWLPPDDLPHAAGRGDFDRVRSWFDAEGRPALGDPGNHYPAGNPQARADLLWGEPHVQQVLDVAFAWACMNKELEIASFLLERGANINTSWGTHEPASVLHECAMSGNYEAAQFLIERGIDMSIRDPRYDATAEGWARYGAGNEEMATFLEKAAQARAVSSAKAGG